MEKYQIEPKCAPDGSDDYLPCDEQHATRWFVTESVDGVWRGTGVFDTRAMAEAYVAGKLPEHIDQLNRADRFTWKPGDVEHH